MKRFLARVLSSTRGRQQPAPTAAPQPLSSAQLRQVAGGLPKGGWGGEPIDSTRTTQLPKGGW